MAAMIGSSPEADDHVYQRRWVILGALCLSLTLIVMDNTILNVAIPSLMRDLRASNSEIQWIIDSYVLVFAGLLLTTGSLSDRFGRKGALQLGLLVFASGSISAALAHSTTHLIASRAFMGIGGALIMPSTLSLLTNIFRDPRERAKAIAIWAAFSGVGAALGPVIGGVLLNHFSWQSVFWVNIPLVCVALGLGAVLIPRSKAAEFQRLDPIGAVLSIVGLASLLFGIIEGPSKGWTSAPVVAAFICGVIALGSFVSWELHTDSPMLDMRLFRNRRFSAASGAITLVFFALFGSMFLMTQYWQMVHGYSALEAGVRMLPHAATMMVVAPLSARFVERLGTKRVVTAGLVVLAVGLALMSMIKVDSSYLHVILIFMMIAAGMGLTMAPATESVMGSLPRDKAGVGSAVNDTTRQVGGALGVAIIGSVVTSVYADHVRSLAPSFGLSGAGLSDAAASLGGALRVAPSMGARAPEFVLAVERDFVSSISVGLRVAAVIIACTALMVWRLLPARATHVGDDPVTPFDAAAAESADIAGWDGDAPQTLDGDAPQTWDGIGHAGFASADSADDVVADWDDSDSVPARETVPTAPSIVPVADITVTSG